MVDTIVLLLTQDMFKISQPDKFTPSAYLLLTSPAWNHGIKCKQNPTKKELLSGIYKPRLTLFNGITVTGKQQLMLKIELSLPKLLFGNNFDELQYKDFELVVRKLVTVLDNMGVIVDLDTLVHAPVSAIHYSKNIILTDGSTPYHYISKLKETNSTLSLDVNQTDYRNEGHCYKWHCNAYEVVFYDKIKDLEAAAKSSKRVLEKDYSLQLNLFSIFKKRNKSEVLRMEVRLNKRQKLKALFSKLDIQSDFTFKKLFKPALSKKILLHYLDLLERKRPALLDYKTSNDKVLFTNLLFNNPNFGPKRIVQMFGLAKILESVTLRELRVMFANYNKRSWYRLMAEVQKVQLPLANRPLDTIRKYLLQFKPTKLAQLQRNSFSGPFTPGQKRSCLEREE